MDPWTRKEFPSRAAMKKVIQFKARCGWNRASKEDIEILLKKAVIPLRAFLKTQGYKSAGHELIDYKNGMRLEFRFASIDKCRPESLKPFTSTHKYFTELEMEAGF